MNPTRRPSSIRHAAVLIGIAIIAALVVPAGSAGASDRSHNARWSGTWATAQQRPFPSFDDWPPNWSMEGFADQSVRQVVRVSAGGSRVRVRLSNLYGAKPLRVTGATIAKTGRGASVRPGTLRPLTFGRSFSATIPSGRDLASDAVTLGVEPLESLTVTLYFARPTGAATFHEGGLTTTYRAEGDRRFDPRGDAFDGETSHSWYYLTGVDVTGPRPRVKRAVVAFGDSLTDGAISTPNANNRYPDELAERLVAEGRPLGVLNAGINGNMLLTDWPCFAGEKGVTRFRRDVLGQPGVRSAIVLEGINDIGQAGQDIGCGKAPVITAKDLIAGHRALIRAARARSIKIVGATLPPFKGNPWYYNEHNDSIRIALNHWIRNGGEYDAVVDLDRALADPDDPKALHPDYDAGDHLHPNDAGMKAIADAIDIRSL